MVGWSERGRSAQLSRVDAARHGAGHRRPLVAEKPSLALAIATHLCGGVEVHTRSNGATPVHEFPGRFRGRACRFRVTAVKGHVYSLDFLPEFQSWEDCEPAELFDAGTLKSPTSGAVAGHVQREARGCSHLVLWLDCDREGENICFEVMHLAVPSLSSAGGRQVWRARFGGERGRGPTAMETLAEPNEAEASAVDARQELDLKVGVAFTRFQTRHFTSATGGSRLDDLVRPVPDATLGFVVQRHVDLSFVSDPFWKIELALLAGGGAHAGEQFDVAWARERLFDQKATAVLCKLVAAATRATVAEVVQAEATLRRPEGLNTVTLLKVASAALGLGAQHTMRVAESLYMEGYLSYPRTESTAYPPGFDFATTLRDQVEHPEWGVHAAWLLDGNMVRPRGVDAGDHPPITPVRAATSVPGGSDGWRVYSFIAKQFLASCPDAKLATTKATFEVAGERFGARAHARRRGVARSAAAPRAGEQPPAPAVARNLHCKRLSRARRRSSDLRGGADWSHGGAGQHRRVDPAAHWQHRGAAARKMGLPSPAARPRAHPRLEGSTPARPPHRPLARRAPVELVAGEARAPPASPTPWASSASSSTTSCAPSPNG